MSENKVNNLLGVSMDKIKEMVDVNTVIGDPITAPDGTTVIPVSRVSYGFAGGGSDLPSKAQPEKGSLPAAAARHYHSAYCVFQRLKARTALGREKSERLSRMFRLSEIALWRVPDAGSGQDRRTFPARDKRKTRTRIFSCPIMFDVSSGISAYLHRGRW